MSEKLDALYSKYQESRAAVEKKEEENAFLEARLSDKQDIVLETMKKDLRGFLEYLKDAEFNRVLFLEDVKLDFYSSSFGDNPNLIVDFCRGDNVVLKCNPSGYSHRPVVFDLNANSWVWYSDKSKTFLAENWGKISSVIEDEICKAFNKAIEGDMQKIDEVQARLLTSIDKVTENIDVSKRKDVLLYNAISLFMDETWDQYEDKDEWFGMLQNELGTSVKELEELGIKITADGAIEAVDKDVVRDNKIQDDTYSTRFERNYEYESDADFAEFLEESHKAKNGFNYVVGARLWLSSDGSDKTIMVEHQIATQECRDLNEDPDAPDWFAAYEVDDNQDYDCSNEVFIETCDNYISVSGLKEAMGDFAAGVLNRFYCVEQGIEAGLDDKLASAVGRSDKTDTGVTGKDDIVKE